MWIVGGETFSHSKYMVATLTQIRDAYEGLAITYPQSISNEDREVINNNLRMYTNETGEISRAQEMGTADEQASALANVANSQFELYRVHFAGKSRLSRRPALNLYIGLSPGPRLILTFEPLAALNLSPNLGLGPDVIHGGNFVPKSEPWPLASAVAQPRP